MYNPFEFVPAHAYAMPFTFTSPEFIPKKHTVMSYAKQRRLARKRNNIRKRLPK